MIKTDTDALVRKLRYMGRQYAAGQVSRGGSPRKHYLEEAADTIERLTRERDEAVARERERWEAALKQTWQMIDPLHPPGSPGSYARGEYHGIVAALNTLRENADRAIATTKATT